MNVPLEQYAVLIEKRQEYDEQVRELEKKRNELYAEEHDLESARPILAVRTIDPEALPDLLLEIHQRLTALEEKA